MSQTIRQYENIKRSNENEVEEIVSNQGKKQQLLGVKQQQQQGLQLKTKSNVKQPASLVNAKNKQKLEKPEQQKPITPQKRAESVVGLQEAETEQKKQYTSTEQTYRRKEKEIEWTPEGLELDFSGFDSIMAEKNIELEEPPFEEDMYIPVFQRSFFAEPSSLPPVAIATSDTTTDNDVIDQETDTTTVEYCPPKEEEIPYLPPAHLIVDVSGYDMYADINAYEYSRRLQKDALEFSPFDDVDALSQLKAQPFDEDALTFDFNVEYTDDEIDMSSDDIDIPFSNHLFDVEEYARNYPAIELAGH